jgi:hypothetical protein
MKIMVILFLCLVSHCFAKSLPPINAMDLNTGKTKQYQWNDAKKGSVVVFLSGQCPCSNAHVKHLVELSQQFPDIKFIGIHSNANESVIESKEYFRSKNLAFPVFQDNSSEWADRLKAYRTPHAFLIDPEGKLVYQGGVTSSADPERADSFFLKVTLKKFIAGDKITNARSRVLGCQIARK